MTAIKLSEIKVKSVKFKGSTYKLNKYLSNAKVGDLLYLGSDTNYIDCSTETFYVIIKIINNEISFIDDVSEHGINVDNKLVKLYSKKEGK